MVVAVGGVAAAPRSKSAAGVAEYVPVYFTCDGATARLGLICHFTVILMDPTVSTGKAPSKLLHLLPVAPKK
jgi:hypothetical protein